MSDKLLPCPFCGGEAVLCIGEGGYIQCASCLGTMPYQYGLEYSEGKAKAIAAWNRRAAGWIPVTPDMPDNTRVLLTNGLGVFIGKWSAAREMFVTPDGVGIYWASQPTHWMPLPEPLETPEGGTKQ